MTREQAKLIVEDMDIEEYIKEKTSWRDMPFKLEQAYRALLALADGVEGP